MVRGRMWPKIRPSGQGQTGFMPKRWVQNKILLFLIGLFILPHGGFAEEFLVKAHPLAACPDSPNCVSTMEAREGHAIAPYRYRTSLPEAKAALKQIVSEWSRTTLVKEEGEYLKFEVRSFLWQFVDDVEFWFEEATQTVHFRSASRTGYSDFGVNRRRMEDLRRKLEGKL